MRAVLWRGDVAEEKDRSIRGDGGISMRRQPTAASIPGQHSVNVRPRGGVILDEGSE